MTGNGHSTARWGRTTPATRLLFSHYQPLTPLATSCSQFFVLFYNLTHILTGKTQSTATATLATPNRLIFVSVCMCVSACVRACVCVHSNLMMTSIVWQTHGRGSSLPPPVGYCSRPHPSTLRIRHVAQVSKLLCVHLSPTFCFLFPALFLTLVSLSVYLLFDSSWLS